MKKNIVKKNNIRNQKYPHENKPIPWLKNNFWIILIIIYTLILFSNALNNKFVNWDDDNYIHKNTSIQRLNTENIKKIFSEPHFANYHPITILTYAIEYHFFKLNPYPYHFNNIVLHLLNILLVYLLIRKLTDRKIIPLITAFVFAVHPMHVESVAWISERKDMLYTLFYISSLLLYLKYLKQKKNIYYIFSLFLFLFSLLSKSAAVTLPLIMLLMSYFINKKFVIKDWLQSIPFFALSLVFGFIALTTQKDAIHIVNLNELYNPFERILLVFYTIHYYLSRFIIPFNLAAVHAFPNKEISQFPLEFYISPLILIVIIILLLVSKKELKQYLIFGFLFFIINILLIVQIIPVGDSVISERYTYVSYIGLAFISAYIIEKYLNSKYRIITVSLILIMATYFSVATYKQTKVWEDSETLWTNSIKKNPKCFLSYYSRGAARAESGQYEKAMEDFNNSINIFPKYAMAFNNRGVIKINNGNIKGAIEDYNKAISLNDNYAKSFNNRGHAHALNTDFDKALQDFNKAISLDTNYVEAYSNRGNLFQLNGKFEEAMSDYTRAININPLYLKAHENTATLFFNNAEYLKAIECYTKVIQLEPKHNVAYYFRGLSKQRLNDIRNACEDWKIASDLGNESAKNMKDAFCK